MNRFVLEHPFVGDIQTQQNNEALLRAVNELGQYVVAAVGDPVHSPAAPQLYIKQDGGVGDSVWAWNTATWTALV